MRPQWTSAAREIFGVSDATPCTAMAFIEHCAGCGFEAPAGLRMDQAGRVLANTPSLVGWTGYAPRIAGDRWILAE